MVRSACARTPSSPRRGRISVPCASQTARTKCTSIRSLGSSCRSRCTRMTDQNQPKPEQQQMIPIQRPTGLTAVREGHQFDEAALAKYLKEHFKPFGGDLSVQQYEGGQSNPTFQIITGGKKFVLRKKPPGTLLPTAHAIEREYRVYRALEDTDVPVPRAYFLCEDPAIIGTSFYVMDHIEGRVFRDSSLNDLSPAERRAIYADMIRVLGALHSVDYKAKGLADYGKPGNYFQRQVTRWTSQYLAAKTHDIASMD